MDLAKLVERPPAAVIVTVATQYDKSLTANEQRTAADVEKSKVFWARGTVIPALSTATNDDLNGVCHWGCCHLLFTVTHLSSATFTYLVSRLCVTTHSDPRQSEPMAGLS